MKRILILLALAVISAPSYSEDKAAKNAEKKVVEQPQELVASEVIEKLSDWDKKMSTLSCAFEQTVRFEDTGITRKIEGKLYFVHPNGLRIEHIKPARQIVITDKKLIMIYKPEEKQVIRAGWKEWISQQSASLAGISDFGDYKSILSRHDVTVSRQPKSDNIILSMNPKSNPKSYTLSFVLGKDYFPLSFTFQVKNTKVETALSKTEINGKLPEELFDLKPLTGYSLMDFSSQK